MALSVGSRVDAEALLELAGEVEGVFEADALGDFADGIGGVAQEVGGAAKAGFELKL